MTPASRRDAAFAPDGAGSRPGTVRQFELTERVAAYDPRADTGLIDAAYVLAAQAHGTQYRDNGDPYITHPVAVADILAGYRLDTDTIVTALLHDVVEDTRLKLPDIEARFGKTVGGLVDGVTKLTKLELKTARSAQAENFRKLVLAMSQDIRVLLVKLADRLHNMRTLHFVAAPERRQRIALETMEIYAPLAERIGMDAMKSELQNLAFQQLETEAFDTIPGAAELPPRPGRGHHRGGAGRAGAGVPRWRRLGGGGERAREEPLLHLGEDAAAQYRLRATVGHHGVPRRRAHPGGVLHGAGRSACELPGDRRALQGLHLDAQVQRLPEPAHRRHAAAAAQPKNRGANPHRRDAARGR